MNIFYIANIRLPSARAHSIQILKMCQSFSKLGHKVTLIHPYRFESDKNLKHTSVFTYYKIDPSFTINRISNLDIIVFENTFLKRVVPLLFIIQSLLWALFSLFFVKRSSETIVFTRDIYVAFWSTLFKFNTFFEVHTVNKGIQKNFYNFIKKSIYLKKIVVITSFIGKELIKNGFNKNILTVQPDAVDLDDFKDTDSKVLCRKKINLDPNKFIIGYIGSFSTMGMEKGISNLVKAMGSKHLVDRNDIILLCVGGPLNNVNEYKRLMHEMDISTERIIFKDRVPNYEVPFWIKSSDILTIPWEWNTFSAYYTSPMKLFEYMASGNPLIASNLPSICEIITHDVNGILVEPGNTEELAKQISYLLANPKLAQRIAVRALADVKKHTWLNRAKNIIEPNSKSGLL